MVVIHIPLEVDDNTRMSSGFILLEDIGNHYRSSFKVFRLTPPEIEYVRQELLESAKRSVLNRRTESRTHTSCQLE